MLISEFARVTELPIDTVRFYVAKGLLKPERSLKGGSNPYQTFKQDRFGCLVRTADSEQQG